MANDTLIDSIQLRRSPAAHLAAAMEAADVAGERAVTLREVAFTTQLGLRAVPGSAGHAALAQRLQVGSIKP